MSAEVDAATVSLKRIQEFDPQTLSRSADLGSANFATLVPPAERLISLYRQIPLTILDNFPPANLSQIAQLADALYHVFQQVISYNIETGNLSQTRASTLQQLTDAYPNAFTILHPYISYSAAQSGDFQRLERDGRAAVQKINDLTADLLGKIESTERQANEALQAAQRAAREQGVSQQAVYFRDAANDHDVEAEVWRERTMKLSIGLGLYAVATVFAHKLPWLKPNDSLESAQLITSKLLIFAVISYMLILAARNFLSHKHNAIVNRHRQNALMTFNALATAASETGAKDIILTHAASCIFAPQETGYAKSASSQDSSLASAMAGLLAKSDKGTGG